MELRCGLATRALARLTGIQALGEIARMMQTTAWRGLRLDGLVSIWHGAER